MSSKDDTALIQPHATRRRSNTALPEIKHESEESRGVANERIKQLMKPARGNSLSPSTGRVANPLFGKGKMLERSVSTRFSSDINDLLQEEETLDNCFERIEQFLEDKDNQMSTRQKLSAMKNFSWSKSFAKLASPKTGRSKKYGTDGVTASSLKVLVVTSPLVLYLEEFIQEEYSLLAPSEEQKSLKNLEEIVEKIYSNLKSAGALIKKGNKSKTMGQVLLKAMETLENATPTGIVDTATRDALETHRSAFISNVVTTLKMHVQQELLDVRSFGIQLIGCMATGNTLMFSSIVHAFVKQIEEILNTNCTICSVIELLQQKSRRDSSTVVVFEDDSDDKSIWAEGERDKECPEGTGTLNTLVSNLTSTTSYESNYTKSFIMTYQSFTKPWNLLTKLKERFEDIPNDISDSERSQIELRVCIVLKYWIETRIFDFDSQLLYELKTFLEGPVTEKNKEMASRLIKTLRSAVESYQKNYESTTLRAFTTRLVETYLEHSITQVSLVLDFSAVTIAQQLSLVDCEMLKKIESVAFLNQSWSKPKLQYRALSLIYFIERLNQYSFWISTLILYHPKKHDRVMMLQKILDIANDLLEVQNNYHAVAGFVVGLNLAAISRLKHTFNDLSKKHKAIMETLNTFMNPHGSYSTYRSTVRSKVLPVIPYIGVYLSDLTFIDEGNPDMSEGFINFSKQDMVYNAIRDVLVFQQSIYEHKANLLLQNYLCALPSLDEKVLYDLSLSYEPRGADASSIK